jgi:hypothetical protein
MIETGLEAQVIKPSCSNRKTLKYQHQNLLREQKVTTMAAPNTVQDAEAAQVAAPEQVYY